jgi:hypothetical protein
LPAEAIVVAAAAFGHVADQQRAAASGDPGVADA